MLFFQAVNFAKYRSDILHYFGANYKMFCSFCHFRIEIFFSAVLDAFSNYAITPPLITLFLYWNQNPVLDCLSFCMRLCKMHCNCNRLIAWWEHFYHQSSMGSIYIKDRWGHHTAREAEQWYQFSAHARSWQQSSYFRKLALSTLSRSTTELTNCSDFLWCSLALMGRDVCPHTVSSLCHTVSHSLCHHITVYIESPTRIVLNLGCFRSFQGVRPNPNEASFGFDRVELSVEASMDNGSWELPAEGGQTYRKLGLEPFNLTGLPVRTAQNWLLWGHKWKMIYIESHI